MTLVDAWPFGEAEIHNDWDIARGRPVTGPELDELERQYRKWCAWCAAPEVQRPAPRARP